MVHVGHRHRCHAGFNDYTVEVVQQIGSDSFTGGSGVLLGKNKNTNSSCGSFNCQTWYIDANPQDINQVDYVKADGTPVKAPLGDERQTNDGTFHAGTNSGSKSEFKAAANDLHFYILDKRVDADGVNRYKIGVRSLAGTGPQTRGVELGHARPAAPPRVSPPARSRSRTRAWRRASRPRSTRRATSTSTSRATSTACRRPPRAPAGRRT